ncbi:hypothetical protein T484DRAFT_1876551 [Baffinella frigidus]|nr:hypothetical protein T484DRAFT_1876551 [Cryptophyta sp. CCMP2293]
MNSDSEFDFDTPGNTALAGLDPQSTEDLLKSIYSHYAKSGNVGVITGARFFKLVRECGLMDSRVTQAFVAQLFDRTAKGGGRGGGAHLDYALFIEALAGIAEQRYDAAGQPMEAFTRMVAEELSRIDVASLPSPPPPASPPASPPTIPPGTPPRATTPLAPSPVRPGAEGTLEAKLLAAMSPPDSPKSPRGVTSPPQSPPGGSRPRAPASPAPSEQIVKFEVT